VLRANDVMRPALSRETFGIAKEILQQAIALDPANSRAYRELAYIAEIGRVLRFDTVSLSIQDIIAPAVNAVQLDPLDARAYGSGLCILLRAPARRRDLLDALCRQSF
jgi:hypothetical protein